MTYYSKPLYTKIMDDVSESMYLERPLLALREHFVHERQDGFQKGGEQSFLAAARRAIILHELGLVDLTVDSPCIVFNKINKSFEEGRTVGLHQEDTVEKRDVRRWDGFSHKQFPPTKKVMQPPLPTVL